MYLFIYLFIYIACFWSLLFRHRQLQQSSRPWCRSIWVASRGRKQVSLTMLNLCSCPPLVYTIGRHPLALLPSSTISCHAPTPIPHRSYSSMWPCHSPLIDSGLPESSGWVIWVLYNSSFKDRYLKMYPKFRLPDISSLVFELTRLPKITPTQHNKSGLILHITKVVWSYT
jgi:hypothetical protein